MAANFLEHSFGALIEKGRHSCVHAKLLLGFCFMLISGKRKGPEPKLFGPDIFGWGGGLPCEGVGGPKVRYVLQNSGKPNFLAGYPGVWAGYPGGGDALKVSKKTKWAKNAANFGETFCRLSPFNLQETWPQEISRKILHIFHEGRNKNLSPRDSGGGGPTLRGVA